MQRIPLRWLVVVIMATTLLRLAAMVANPTTLLEDRDAYLGHAQTLLDGNGYCVPGTQRPTAFRPPAVPFLLAGLNSLGLSLSVAVAAINLLSMALLQAATFRLTAALAGNLKRCLAAAAIVGIDPLLFRYSLLPMTECLSAALLTLAVSLIVPRNSSARAFAVAGLLFGLGALCRPILLVCCAAVSIAYVLTEFRSLRFQAVVKPGLMSALAVSVMLPWVLRNAQVFGEFVPATTHGGYTLLLANNPVFYAEVVKADVPTTWQAESLDRWQQSMKDQMAADGVNLDNEPAADRWYYAKAKASIAADRAAFVRACLLRLKRFWALTPSQSTSSSLLRIGCGIWYAAVFAFAAVGLIRNVRSNSVWLLVAVIAAFLLLHTFYWTNTRMRAPLTGLLTVLAVTATAPRSETKKL